MAGQGFPCLFHLMTGLYCPGCGGTRAVRALFRGDLAMSLSLIHILTAWQLGSLLMAGVAATGGQFGITAAYCYAPARDISVYDYSQIVFSAILGFFLFGQLPDVYSWMGYGVICAMAVWMFFMERNGGAKARA